MKKIGFFSVLLLLHFFQSVTAQNVGIGTASPIARLHVADSSVLFTGPVAVNPLTEFGPPASGAGTRFMWYPQKAAFRVGYVPGSNWDKDNVGLYSMAMGYGGMAKGDYSISMGVSATASGDVSTSMGFSTIASGLYSTSMGVSTIASGNISTSMGWETKASGQYSTSMGYQTNAVGPSSVSMGQYTFAYGNGSTSMGTTTFARGTASVSMGNYTTANGFAATSMGNLTTASADYSTSMGISTKASGIAAMAIGSNNIARSNNALVIGTYNDTSLTNSLFEIGNGTADNARRNALTVLTNGNIGVGNINPDAPLAFPNIGGEKIALFPFTSSQRHGLGVFLAPNYSAMRFYVPAPADYFSWGTGSIASFTENMSLDGNGTLRVKTAVIAPYAFAPSDLRFKTGLVLISSPLEKIRQLNGYTYHYRTEGFPEKQFSEREQVGVVAQEVEAVMPQAVSTDNEGYKSVDYAKLVPLLIESVKLLEQRLMVQQKEIQELRKELKHRSRK